MPHLVIQSKGTLGKRVCKEASDERVVGKDVFVVMGGELSGGVLDYVRKYIA